MSQIEEIVRDHKGGRVAYHVALDELVHLGMIQEEAHELLFPPIGKEILTLNYLLTLLI